MPEYTDLECKTHETAMAVDEYLRANVKDDAELGRIDSVVVKSTVRITYLDLDRNHRLRHGVDMQLLGFRDGYEANSNRA